VATKRISTKQFRQTYKPGDTLPEDICVCHAEPFELLKDADGDGLTKTFTISTDSVDRENDRLLANWELDNYNKGGSVLWGHDSRSTPMHVVAAPLRTWQEGGSLRSRAKFTPKDVNPVGYMVNQLIDFGALRSSSVGFLPKEWKIVDDEARHGYDFERLELLEWSVVPVPANPEAIVDAKAHGIDIAPLVSWTGQALDEGVEIIGVERDLLEATWKLISSTTVAMRDGDAEPEAPAAEPEAGDAEPEATEPEPETTDEGDAPEGDAPAADDDTDVVTEPEPESAAPEEPAPDGEATTQQIEKLTQERDELAAEVKRLTPPPAPADPDDIMIDLANPETLKALGEVVEEQIDKQIRSLTGRIN